MVEAVKVLTDSGKEGGKLKTAGVTSNCNGLHNMYIEALLGATLALLGNIYIAMGDLFSCPLPLFK